MPKKRSKAPATDRFDDLLRAFALRRLQGGSPTIAKPTKSKRGKGHTSARLRTEQRKG